MCLYYQLAVTDRSWKVQILDSLQQLLGGIFLRIVLTTSRLSMRQTVTVLDLHVLYLFVSLRQTTNLRLYIFGRAVKPRMAAIT
ncbi:unnamed protein product [Protopolystoma xenopodis]|uniref:Uncharacterized protein n=1 Tax=Protopolystoma xenopodis TaxID=117903 RepID=A0A448WXR6_9PLAT|nr:unnamed protein product [Protopolystoma xenopodis]